MTGHSEAPRISRAPQKTRPDDALNDHIQALLREAAESLAERTRAQVASDAEAAARQLDEILALARDRDRSAQR
jgi:hypothetical protein